VLSPKKNRHFGKRLKTFPKCRICFLARYSLGSYPSWLRSAGYFFSSILVVVFAFTTDALAVLALAWTAVPAFGPQ
jgi:hypothetical protein